MVPCKACGLLHSPLVRCEVAKNLLGKAEELRARTNVQELNAEAVQELGKENGAGSQPVVPKSPAPAKAARWDKAAYNKYMKEYMRKRRAKAKVDHGKVQDV